MRAKQAGYGLVLLWFTGCATHGPTSQAQMRKQAQEQAQEEALLQAQIKTQLQAQIQVIKQEQVQTLTAPQMLASLQRIASLDPKIAKQMLEHGKSRSAELTLLDRFELVLLLSKKGADDKSLKRASLLLDGLESEATEPGVQQILRLQRRNLMLEQQYRMERKKTDELEKKIEHLKGLERELDESNRRMDEALSPKPGPVQ